MDSPEELPQENQLGTLYKNSLAKSFLSKVYAWMSLSMLVTVGVALYGSRNEELIVWVLDHFLMLGITTLVIVCIMSLAARRLSSKALAVLLIVFAAMEGIFFGPVLLVYTQQTLTLAFACTAGTFGVMALYGALTKRNLSPWGGALFMILAGLIIASIANIFWGNGTLDLILCYGGVLLFAIYTAYDTQKILEAGVALTGEDRNKAAILGALDLYLDFINLFVHILRILSRYND